MSDSNKRSNKSKDQQKKGGALTPKQDGQSLAPKDLFDDAFSKLSSEEKAELRRKVAEKAIDMEAEKRKQANSYMASRQELDDLADRYEEMNKNTKLGSGYKIEQEFKTASGKAKVTARSGSSCFVATAVYGSSQADQVLYLRHYRDNVLQKTPAGIKFVEWYYDHGPSLASFVEHHSWLRQPCKVALNSLISLIKVVERYT